MKLRIALLCMVLLPVLAHAEIYKWKDKDGKVRYSDVPPPSNMQTESLYGKKIPRPTGLAPLTPVEGDATVAANKQKEVDKQKGINKEKSMDDIAGGDKAGVPLTKEQEAAKRAKDAEEKKKAENLKAEEIKAKQENCKTAQANLKNYMGGGRLVRMNEKGEREYMSDTDVVQAREQAQQEVDKYCGT